MQELERVREELVKEKLLTDKLLNDLKEEYDKIKLYVLKYILLINIIILHGYLRIGRVVIGCCLLDRQRIRTGGRYAA